MPVRRRACWLHEWTSVGAGAIIQRTDSAVCAGDGAWHPGGVALASALHLSRAQDYSGFRLIIEGAPGGDLLMGITQQTSQQPGVQPIASDDDGEGGAEGTQILETGYHYIMGRRLGADGEVRVDCSGGVGMAPRSIFYGGRSRRCCFAPPAMQEGASIHQAARRSTWGLVAFRQASSQGYGMSATGSSSRSSMGSCVRPTIQDTPMPGASGWGTARFGCQQWRGLEAEPAFAWVRLSWMRLSSLVCLITDGQLRLGDGSATLSADLQVD